MLDRVACSPVSPPEPESLIGIAADRGSALAGAACGAELAPESHPRLINWCRDQGLPTASTVFSLDIQNPLPQHVGLLQVLSSAPLPPRVSTEFRWLSGIITQAVIRRREERRLEVVEGMRFEPDLRRPSAAWFSRAERILEKITYAKRCLIYRQGSDLQFYASRFAGSVEGEVMAEPLVVSRESRTTQVAVQRRLVRIRDLQNPEERLAKFKTTEYDEQHVRHLESLIGEQLRSLMMAPVVVGGHTIAVIMLVNKSKGLARQFSQTDESVCRTVCDFLSGVIPGVETFAAMRQLSELAVPQTLEGDLARSRLYEWLHSNIPGVACAAIYSRRHSSEPYAYRPLGGADWFDRAPLPVRPNMMVVELPRTSTQRRYRLLPEIPHLTPGEAILAIGLTRDYVSDYERQMLQYFCAELSHILRSEQIVRERLEELVQIRHVIRAGLHGICNIQVALRMYNRVKRSGDLSELLGAQFRKLLERTDMFSRRTNHLLEESRFLLDEITPDSLRIGRHSVMELINEVRLCLNPEAERRRIDVRISSRLPYNGDSIDMDLDLIEIVLFNIVDNAIKYSFRERTVNVETYFEATGVCVIAVTNQGVHIRPEDYATIFRRFTRRPTGQHATTRPGTGLGLAVAKEIVTAHRGTIDVASVVQRTVPDVLAQTTFTVRLPRRHSER